MILCKEIRIVKGGYVVELPDCVPGCYDETVFTKWQDVLVALTEAVTNEGGK